MKKTILLMVILLLSLTGCGNKTITTEGYSFTDDLGRTVTVSDTTRVGVLLGSFTHMWYLSGGTVCASADDAWDDFKMELNEETVNLGSTHRPNREALLRTNPTFVIASAKLAKHLEMQEMLNGLGIPVAYFDVGNFTDYLRVLKIMTDITERPDLYEKYGTDQKIKIDLILSEHKRGQDQTVLVMRASAASIRAKNSEDTMLGGMLSDFGCVNIADSNGMLLDNLSIESIILTNPDKIFFIETGDDPDSIKKAVENLFAENPLWSELDAVKNGKVFFMEKELYNLKPNHRFAEAYEKLEKILYEE